MAFAGFLYIHHGAEVASLFVTGYALEKVLSVDNLFVMMAIFSGSPFGSLSPPRSLLGDHWCHCLQGHLCRHRYESAESGALR